MSKKRVSQAQWELIVDHLEKHQQLARGYNNSSRGREQAARLWRELATLLNAEGSGVTKLPQEWATYFHNFKSKLKAKVADFNKKATGTGGGPNRSEEFTEMELRLLGLLGSGFGQGLPNVQVNPFPDITPVIEIEPPENNMEVLSANESTASIHSTASVLNCPPAQVDVVLSQEEPPPPVLAQVPLGPVRTRRARQKSRPMAPIDEARRILSQVEMQRAAADQNQAQALYLIAENLGRLASAVEQYLQRT